MGTGAPEIRTDPPVAIVSLTRAGVELGRELSRKLPKSVRFIPARLAMEPFVAGASPFERLADVVEQIFHGYHAIVFIMATGIVVRHIAALLGHKGSDPAVVVLDEKGRFAVSLLSGHVGGANRLARRVACITGGQAVVTTASDIEDKPALDVIALDLAMEIDNPGALPRVARAILEDEPLWLFDPEGLVATRLSGCPGVSLLAGKESGAVGSRSMELGTPTRLDDPHLQVLPPEVFPDGPGVLVSERLGDTGELGLVLRPRTLVVGLGCNRNTGFPEILELLLDTFRAEGLSLLSIRNLASVDVKRDEPAILEAARALGRPVHFYSRQELEGISVPNPSAMVRKHLGVGSVCEAAALLSARTVHLMIPKRKTPNVTLAVARAS